MTQMEQNDLEYIQFSERRKSTVKKFNCDVNERLNKDIYTRVCSKHSNTYNHQPSTQICTITRLCLSIFSQSYVYAKCRLLFLTLLQEFQLFVDYEIQQISQAQSRHHRLLRRGYSLTALV